MDIQLTHRAIQEHLKDHPLVENFEMATPEEGGARDGRFAERVGHPTKWRVDASQPYKGTFHGQTGILNKVIDIRPLA